MNGWRDEVKNVGWSRLACEKVVLECEEDSERKSEDENREEDQNPEGEGILFSPGSKGWTGRTGDEWQGRGRRKCVSGSMTHFRMVQKVGTGACVTGWRTPNLGIRRMGLEGWKSPSPESPSAEDRSWA